jgi:hypothetical protein
VIKLNKALYLTSNDSLCDATLDDQEPYRSSTAFILWCVCLLGACGIHRFYLKRPLSGLLYLLTFGLLGIGQIIDLFRIKDMVLLANVKDQRLLGRRPIAAKRLPPASLTTKDEVRQRLVQAAARNGGQLSVTHGVMATGKSHKEVEELLDEMARSGYVGIDNDEKTGAVVYTFGELSNS